MISLGIDPGTEDDESPITDQETISISDGDDDKENEGGDGETGDTETDGQG